MKILEFLNEVNEYYANLVFVTRKHTDKGMPYVITSKQLVEVVLRWTTCPETEMPHFLSMLEKAHRGDLSSIPSRDPETEMPIL